MADTPKIWLEQVARDGTEPGDEDRAAAFRVTKSRNTTQYLVGDYLDIEDLELSTCDFVISAVADKDETNKLF
jgi:hypothetical protein